MTHRLFKTKETGWRRYKEKLEQVGFYQAINQIKSAFHNPVKSGELRNMGNEEKWEKQEGSGMWIPKDIDDELIGEITDINTEGTYGNQYVIKKQDDEEILTPSHKVLQNRLMKAKIGDKIKVVYKGEEPPTIKGNNPTKMYEVFIKTSK